MNRREIEEWMERWDAWDRFWGSSWGLAVFTIGLILLVYLAVKL